MTKEELEKKRDHLYLEFRNDLIRICHYDEYKSEDYDLIAQTMIPFKEGFDSAVALLLPRLEEAEERLLELDALERMGVKHWEWYDEAMELIND